MATEYIKFPKNGQSDEKSKAERNEDLVYQNEYKNAPKMAEKLEAPIRVDPNAPSVPSVTA